MFSKSLQIHFNIHTTADLGVAYNGYDATYGDVHTVVTHGSIYEAGDPNNYCLAWNFSVINPGFTQGII